MYKIHNLVPDFFQALRGPFQATIHLTQVTIPFRTWCEYAENKCKGSNLFEYLKKKYQTTIFIFHS